MVGKKTRYGYSAWMLSAAMLIVTTMAPYTANAQSALQDVYRFIRSNKHLYTLSYAEGTGAGFTFQTVAFTAFVSADDADMIPLYRCYKASNNDHFVSVDPNCEGQVHEGSFGYVSSVPRVGFTALYRFYSSGNRDHLITKIASEGSGWTPEGILGYVPL